MAQEKTIAATKAAHQKQWCAGIAANELAKGTTAGTPSRQFGGEAPTGRKAAAVEAARRRVRQITVRPGETVGRAKISAVPAPPTIAARAAVSELPATKSATAAPAKAKKGAAGANRTMGCTDQTPHGLKTAGHTLGDITIRRGENRRHPTAEVKRGDGGTGNRWRGRPGTIGQRCSAREQPEGH
jgi:hypothetical protein